MKMSDVFELPLVIKDNGCQVQLHLVDSKAKSAAHAINNYDRLVSLLSELINSEDITFFESAIESGGPSYMNLQEWSDKARDLLDELGENK